MNRQLFSLLIITIILLSCTENQTKVYTKTSNNSDSINSIKPIVKINKDTLIFGNLAMNNLPTEIVFEGKIISSSTWKDKEGEHIAFTTETGEYISKKFKHDEHNEGRDAELFGYHYLKKEKADNFTLRWKVYDYECDCPLDLVVSFIKNTFQITDLDKDGIAETWMMYKITCVSDVSPIPMKIIMYEGDSKFLLKGHNKVHVSEKDSMGGEYTFDKNFKNGPDVFLNFAKELWKKNILNKWGE